MDTSQKQSLATLRFFLYDRPLHPELFEIHDDHLITRPSYEAQIWVTGCTHVTGFFRDRQSLVEVVAGTDQQLPQKGRLLEFPFRGERDHERKRAGGISYMMSFQVESMSPDVYSRTHHELARLGARRGLFVPFPKWMARSLTPFTYIDYDAKPNELHVFAFHAFPEDLTVVKTQSIFELG
jgi:hypothetical protein